MGRSWCADLPRVTPERSRVPNPVTLIVPYYECPTFFARQLETWHGYRADLRANLRVIVVDDGSPTHPASNVPKDVRLFRIEQNLRWNWIAARNIGANHAPEGWLLLTDMDHVVPESTLESVIYSVRRHDTIYGFARMEHTGEWIEPHKNSWLLTRSMFWKVGGYDETLSGHYGTDGDWRRRCASTAKMAILSDPLVRYEFVDDASTSYPRKLQEDTQFVQRTVASRRPGWTPKTLSFPYQEVTCSVS